MLMDELLAKEGQVMIVKVCELVFDDLLNQVGSSKVLSKFDFSNGFYQIPVKS